MPVVRPLIRYVRTHRQYYKLVLRVAVFELLFGVCLYSFSDLLLTGRPDGDSRVGFLRGQFCFYSRLTIAGATPPSLEKLINPVLPLVRIHEMGPFYAGYTAVAVPLWPLLLWTALRLAWMEGSGYVARQRSDGDKRRGFEPIFPAEDSKDDRQE